MQFLDVPDKHTTDLFKRWRARMGTMAQEVLDLAKNPRPALRGTPDHDCIRPRVAKHLACFARTVDVAIGDNRYLYARFGDITWEIAGSSHSSYEGFIGRMEVFGRDQGAPAALPNCESTPYSRVPASRVYQAAYAHMVTWLRDGSTPPTAPFMKREGNTLARDAHGLVTGGIQLAEYAVPTADNNGSNSGSGFCRLYGSHSPYSQDTLDALYPSHMDYLDKVMRVNDANLEAGYILKPGAAKTTAAALQRKIGH
jgi:hypothetical protein